MLKNIKAIYFDLDNTLISRDNAFQEMIVRLFAQKNLKIDIRLIMHIDNHGYTNRMAFSEWLVDMYPALQMTAEEVYTFGVTQIHKFVCPLDDELLTQLQNLGQRFKIGIITNGSIQNQTAKYNQAGLSKVFDINKLYISQAYQTAKPETDFFKIVLDDLELDAQQMLYIGDNPKADIWGPNQLQIKTCWVSNGRTWAEPYSPTFQTASIRAFLDKQILHAV